jgi:hypothetical protein
MASDASSETALDTLYDRLQQAITGLEQNPCEQTALPARKAWRFFLYGPERGVYPAVKIGPGLLDASADQLFPLVRANDARSLRGFTQQLENDARRLKAGMKKAPGAPKAYIAEMKLPDLDNRHLPVLSALSDAIARYKATLPPEPPSPDSNETGWGTRVREGMGNMGGRIKG